MAREVIGTVVNASPKGLLVKAKRKVNIGSTLVDVRNAPVGRVNDVLGPVASPYLLVGIPKNAPVQKLLNKELYTP